MRLFDRFAMGVLCDPVSAIAGGVGLVGNVVGGFIGNSAANNAAKIQQQGAKAAADSVGVATGQANAGIADATKNAQDLATAGGNRVIDTAGQAKAVSDEATKNANSMLDPYATAGQHASGTLDTGLAAGGDFNKSFTNDELLKNLDPGYAFRLQQGETTLNRSAAARGGAVSGDALKALANYSQGLASTETQNAFNRYETDTQGRYSRLFGEQGVGQAASGQQGANLMTAAQYGGNITTGAANTALGANEYTGTAGMQGAGEIGQNITGGAKTAADYLTGGAAAAAAGKIGAANAWSGALGGVANSAMGAASLYNQNKFNNNLTALLKNPATGRP